MHLSRLEWRQARYGLYHRTLALLRPHEEHPSLQHPSNNTGDGRLHRLLGCLRTVSIHSPRALQEALLLLERRMRCRHAGNDDLVARRRSRRRPCVLQGPGRALDIEIRGLVDHDGGIESGDWPEGGGRSE